MPSHPEQNGHVERQHRHIFTVTRLSLTPLMPRPLSESKLPSEPPLLLIFFFLRVLVGLVPIFVSLVTTLICRSFVRLFEHVTHT